MEAIEVLVLLGLLMVKHMFADYFLQTKAMLCNRDLYLHPGRVLHCIEHVVGSVICLVIMGVSAPLIAILAMAEFIAHYHIDYGKGMWGHMSGHTPADAGFWRAFGVDQTLHMLTYILMVWAVI